MNIKQFSLCSHRSHCFGAGCLLVILALATILWPQCAPGQQPPVPKLTLAQVEQLVSSKVPDSTLNTQIQRRGLAFTPTPAMIESLRAKGAGPLTLAAIETFFPKATLSLVTSRDLIYMPSHQGLGLIELSVAEGAAKRTAKTVLFNNNYVLWNVHQQEFYVVGLNGDAVSVISAGTFTQTAAMKGDVGWNTFSTALSPDGRSLYLACFGGSPQTLRIVAFDTASRSHRATQAISGGGSAAYLALSPDGDRVYVASGSILAEYETSDLRLLRQQSFEGWPLIVSPDGRFLFSVQQDRLLRIRTDGLSVDKSLTLPEAAFRQLSLSRDGRNLFASGKNAIYRVPLSLDTYIPIRPPHGVDSGIQFAESADGRALYVLSGGNNQESLWVIDLATEQVMKTIDGIAFPASIIAVPGALMRGIPKRDDLPDASSNSDTAPSQRTEESPSPPPRAYKITPTLPTSGANPDYTMQVDECHRAGDQILCSGKITNNTDAPTNTYLRDSSAVDDEGNSFFVGSFLGVGIGFPGFGTEERIMPNTPTKFILTVNDAHRNVKTINLQIAVDWTGGARYGSLIFQGIPVQ